jgi:hypothetical protein
MLNSVHRNSVPGNAWSSSFRTSVRTLRLYKHRCLFREAGAKRSARRAADRRRIGVSKRHRGGLERAVRACRREASGWYGIGAPKGTPVGIINVLNTQINAGLADPKIKARIAVTRETPTSASSPQTKPRNGASGEVREHPGGVSPDIP